MKKQERRKGEGEKRRRIEKGEGDFAMIRRRAGGLNKGVEERLKKEKERKMITIFRAIIRGP